jgi:hypothetical protein
MTLTEIRNLILSLTLLVLKQPPACGTKALVIGYDISRAVTVLGLAQHSVHVTKGNVRNVCDLAALIPVIARHCCFLQF